MLLQCEDITYQYPEMETLVFEGLSCSLTKPGFHGLFGPSGVGKSTLAKLIAGEVQGFTGQVITTKMENILYSYNLERLPGWSSVGEHVAKVTPKGRENMMKDLLESFGLTSCLHSRFSQLSLGQKNRINLTRYLLQNFELLIMDESLANVDEATREQIILTVKEMFPDKCFLYISHSVMEVSKYCDAILVLRSVSKKPQIVSVDGRDYAEGQILDRKDLEQTMLEIVNAS